MRDFIKRPVQKIVGEPDSVENLNLPQADGERRRYQRVIVAAPLKQVDELASYVIWPLGDRLKIIDISCHGMSLERPAHLTPDPEMRIKLDAILAGRTKPLTLQARVVRVTVEQIALEFAYVEAATMAYIERFVRARQIGAQVRLLDSRLWAKNFPYTHWLQGPGETQIYLCYVDGMLSRAQVEYGGSILEVREGKITVCQADDEFKAQVEGLLSQVADQQKLVLPLRHALYDSYDVETFKKLK